MAQEFRMGDSDRITTCDGFFVDSGGTGASYQPNERAQVTICSDDDGGSHIQMIFSAPAIAENDELCFYDGETTDAPRLSCVSDFASGNPFIIQATAANPSGCITITFQSDGSVESDGWSADILCTTACQLIQSELVETTPEVMPTDTGWVDGCPGDRIFLKARGRYPQNGLAYQHSDATASFTWNFGDGTIAVGPEVSHTYDESGGYTVQLTITDQFGCRSTNFLSQRVRISTRPDFQLTGDLPPETCAGDTVGASAIINRIDAGKTLSVLPTEGSFQFGGTRSDSLALPDGTGASYETSINFTAFAPGQLLTDVNDLLGICVNMEHSWMRDLQISLMCPDGSSVLLHNHPDQSGGSVFLGEPNDNDDNLIRPGVGYDYCWTPDAVNPNWIDYANQNFPQTLPPGDYQSYENFRQLVGCPLNGEWTIRVEDLWGQDNGFIFSWGINFNPDLFPNLETFTPELVDYGWKSSPYTTFSSPDSLAAAPQNAGKAQYVFEVTDDFGCTYDTTLSVKVLPPTHPDCFSCQELLAPVADTAICPDEQVSLNVGINDSEQTDLSFESFPAHPIGSATYPPGSPYRAAMEISDVLPATLNDPTTQIISVCVDMETDWTGDIALLLQAPSGVVMTLANGNGGDGDNFSNTCFTPTAPGSINAGSPPFTGAYLPQDDWNLLNGTPVAGEWALLVSDALGIEEVGRLNSWSITFQSANEVTYSWTPATGLSCTDCPAPIASPAQTVVYRVEAANSYGCAQADTIVVGRPSEQEPPQVSCTVAEDPSMTFTWPSAGEVDRFEVRTFRNDGASDWIDLGSATQYEVTGLQRREEVRLELRYFIGVDPINCTFPISTAACTFQPCDLEAALEEAPLAVSCPGDTDGAVRVRASGGDQPYAFAIDGRSETQADGAFDLLAGGSHFVVVRDTGICFDTLFFDIPEPDTLVVAIEQTARGCRGDAANEAVAIASGGNGGYQYLWSDGRSGATQPDLDSLVYSVTATDSQGCTAASSLKLQDLPTFNPNVIQSAPTCFGGDDGQLAINLVEGGLTQDPADYTFQWSTGQTGPLIENLKGGLEYQVTVTSQEDCFVVATRTLRQPAPITFDVLKDSIQCADDPTGSATVTNIQGDNEVFNIQWNDAAGGRTTPTADGLPAGDYSVTVTDDDGCSSSQQFTFIDPPPIEVRVEKEDNACFGDSDGRIELRVSGGVPDYTIAWSNGAAGPSLSELPAAGYGLSVTDNNGCVLVDTVRIAEPPLLQATLIGTDPSCFGYQDGVVSAEPTGGTAPYGFSLDNQSYSNSNQFGGLSAGTYQVYLRDSKGCRFFDQITLQEPAEFLVSAGADLTIPLGDSVELVAEASNAEGAVEFVWSAPYEGTLTCTECAATISTTFNTITYELYGIDARGCEATNFITINVDKVRMVDVPTGFTPNDDGINDRLLVHGKEGTRIRTFRVFDRWGELIFEATDFSVNDPDIGWDGFYKGQPMNSGVFLWYLEVEYLDGAQDVFKGQTTLIR